MGTRYVRNSEVTSTVTVQQGDSYVITVENIHSELAIGNTLDI